MPDKMKELGDAIARARCLRSKADDMNRAISVRAEEWLQGAEAAASRLGVDEAETIDPKYNATGYLRLARDRGTLRRLRDGA